MNAFVVWFSQWKGLIELTFLNFRCRKQETLSMFLNGEATAERYLKKRHAMYLVIDSLRGNGDITMSWGYARHFLYVYALSLALVARSS